MGRKQQRGGKHKDTEDYSCQLASRGQSINSLCSYRTPCEGLSFPGKRWSSGVTGWGKSHRHPRVWGRKCHVQPDASDMNDKLLTQKECSPVSATHKAPVSGPQPNTATPRPPAPAVPGTSALRLREIRARCGEHSNLLPDKGQCLWPRPIARAALPSLCAPGFQILPEGG
jgi:hypothetical protein